MGLFSREPKERLPYEVPGFLGTREIRKLEKKLFSGGQTGGSIVWLLAFGAPMLGKDGQYIDSFPHYSGKKYDKMEKAFQSAWGKPSENTVEEQLREMLLGSCARTLDPLYEMTRDYPKEQWDSQILRLGDYGSKHSEKIGDMEAVYRRIHAFDFPITQETLYAYDLCRAANLICIAVGLEVLRPANATYYLEQVAWAANRFYPSWEEYYGAFVVGRCLWLWKMGQFLAMGATVDSNICQVLLRSPKGPCTQYELGHALSECAVPLSYYRQEELSAEEDE